MLEMRNVRSYYGMTPILQGMTFHVRRGGLTCVLGRNGVGKTTLLKTLMGLTTRMEGVLVLDGQDISALATHERARRGLGYVPQGRGILPRLTIRENLLLSSFARTGKEKQDVPDDVLELFPYLAQNMNRLAGALSGGQAQQLAFARALATRPRLLLLDEPTEGIQPNIVEQIQQLIRRLNRELGLSIVLVEQHVRFARSAATDYAILDKGAVVSSGPIEALTDDIVDEMISI